MPIFPKFRHYPPAMVRSSRELSPVERREDGVDAVVSTVTFLPGAVLMASGLIGVGAVLCIASLVFSVRIGLRHSRGPKA